ncbi:cation-independent mannose-6-phosphate receptor isoform X1 [Cloeon dipterum]|uniref:cation-independent mannose-6-phosphate receptor isoform X1 n=1 Tax=Cloeon dipterum TaxID=197152 RepID=UPI003220222D
MWARFVLLAAGVACAATAVSSHCLYTITGDNGDPQTYDFSSLATIEPWTVPIVSDSMQKSGTLFLSVCGPLKGLTKAQCPDEDASGCLARKDGEQWRTLVPSAAAATANTTLVLRNGSPVLIMPGHSPCEPGRNYTIILELLCNQEKVLAPFFLGLTGCEIALGWITAAACPTTKTGRACSLAASGGYWFDLYPLANDTAYRVAGANGRQFYLNLCAPVAGRFCPGQKAAACEVKAKTSLARYDDSVTLRHAPNGYLVSTQRSDNGSVALEIRYYCEQLAPLKTQPKFIKQENGITYFAVHSPYACPPVPVDCVAYTRQGVKIDLSPLRKTNSYWTVRDPRSNYTHQLYYINVCAPLPRSLPSPCHAGNVGACISNSNQSDLAQPLGLVEHPPRVTKDGDLILTYRDGSLCPDLINRRKIHINFKCHDVERGPEFLIASDDCVYSFMWLTPAACEPKPDQGDNCRVLDSRMLYSFDLRSIYNKMHDYEVQMESYSYRVNLCGPLHKPCNNVKNVNVCLVLKNGTEIAIGMRNDRLEYSDGRLSLRLTGQECLPGVKSSVTAILACEHIDPDGGVTQPHVFASGAGDCNYYLVWNHPRACPPYKEVPCTVQGEDGALYDLSPLSRRSINHMARTRLGNPSGVLLNVCRSVVFNRDANCESTSGACLREGDKFINLGNVQKGPTLDRNVLKLHYVEGALCHAPQGPVHVTTTITFLCDEGAIDSQPEYLGEFQCDHALFWRTSAACPQRPVSGHNCSVLNPSSKFRFDLSPLAGQDHLATDDYDNPIALAVCSDLSSTNNCNDNASAACLTTKSNGKLSLGRSSSELRFLHGGTLELRYKGGDACGVGRTRETTIEFFCGAEGSLEGPRFVETLQGCITVIHWHTRLACEQQVACSNSLLGLQTDLSPLIRVTQNYRAELPDGRIYFLNVCRPLVPQSKLNCGAGAAACVARKLAGGKMVEELSLGYASTSPTITADGALLIYSGGSACPRRPSVNASTRIDFICDPYGVNSGPIFDKESPECQYSFIWHTSLVCGPEEEEVQGCKVYVSQLKRFLSLDSLGGQVEVGKYTIDLCGRGRDCSGNAVCQRSAEGTWASYGILQKAVLYGDYLKLYFGGGATCVTNKTYGAEVWLGCDSKSNGTGAPRLLMERPCYAIFEWKSDALCLQRNASPTLPTSRPDVPVEPAQQDAMPASHSFAVASLVLCSVITVAAVVVIFVRRRYPLLCLSWRFPWPSSASHTQVHYSRALSVAEANAALHNHQELEWDSDEELLKL